MKKLLLVLSFLFLTNLHGQVNPQDVFDDKCGVLDPELAQEMLQVLGEGWGYNYDSLSIDLDKWSYSPFVQIDSIGTSIQGRILWMLTITDTLEAVNPRRRISIHARTHPNEVQAWWVTDEMIEIFLGESELAKALRRDCIINVIPMYNPDGVELGKARQNANNVDIESNWNKNPLEVEVQALKNLFEQFMASQSPIEVALNMHSSFSCTRYFVYHHENGTSELFTEYEKNFIGGIKSYWDAGFEPWDYFKSWTSGTPTQYPESWFWLNYQEAVMALTYEDMNCESAGNYAQTAEAMLNGVADYMGIDKSPSALIADSKIPESYNLLDVYPNPIAQNRPSTIRLQLAAPVFAELAVFDILGRKVKTIKSTNFNAGTTVQTLNNQGLAGGVYFVSFDDSKTMMSKKILIVN